MSISGIIGRTETAWRGFSRAIADRRGTTAIEYALIAGGISIAILLAVSGVGSQVVILFTAVSNAF